MIQISNRMIDKINSCDANILATTLYNHNGDILTGFDVLEAIVACLRAYRGRFCYYADVIKKCPHLLGFRADEDDWDAAANNGVWLTMIIFKALCDLKLVNVKDTIYANWLGHQTDSVIFSSSLNESKYSKEQAAQNNPVEFMRTLYKMPLDARNFAIQEYATRLGAENLNGAASLYNTPQDTVDDVRISDHWGSTFGVPTTDNRTIRGQWAWGRITNQVTRSGKPKWEILGVHDKMFSPISTIAGKVHIVNQVIKKIYSVDPQQAAKLEAYKVKLNKGLTK